MRKRMKWKILGFWRASLLLLLTAATLASLSWVLKAVASGEDVAKGANLVGLLGLPAALVSATLAAVPMLKTPPRLSSAYLDEELEALAQDIRAIEDSQRAWLYGDIGAPVDLRFSLIGGSVRQVQGAAAFGEQSKIYDYFKALTPRRLVITGAPGAGKTVLAAELTMRILASRQPGDPVPLRLSMADWNAEEQPFEAWLERDLVEKHQLAPRTAELLTRNGKLIPVLDGLDEMDHISGDSDRAAAAMKRLNKLVLYGNSAPIILVCRSSTYRRLRSKKAQLHYSATILIQDISAQQIHDYLHERVGDSAEWQSTLADLSSPRSTIAGLVTTPWQLTLAYTTFSVDGDPRTLTSFSDWSTMRQVLMGQYIRSAVELHPSGIPTEGEIRKTARGLTFLARRLRECAGNRYGEYRMSGMDMNLDRIWPIGGPRRVRFVAAALVALSFAPVFAILLWLFARRGHIDGSTGWIFSVAAVIPLMGVLDTVRGRPHPRRIIFSRLYSRRGTGRLAGSVGMAAALGATFAVAFDVSFGVMFFLGFTFVFCLGFTVAVRDSVDTVAVFAVGFAIAYAFGLAAGFASEELGRTSGLLSGLTAGAVGLVAAVWVGLRVARRKGGGAPNRKLPGPVTPTARLRHDLTAGVFAGGTAGTVSGFAAVSSEWIGAGPASAALLALAVTISVCLGFVSSATRFYLAMIVCTRGQLPWRVGAFLRRSHGYGLLRLSGSTYQFRHDDLRRWLAA